MKILNEQEKRDSLIEILIELSKSQDTLKEAKQRAVFFRRFENIYYNYNEKNFRHYYSDIFSTLTLIDGDLSLGSLDILAQNIQTIKDGYKPTNQDETGELIDISKEIIKLYDHTNLDIARINYTKTMTNNTMSELAKNELLIDNIEKKLHDSEKVLDDLSNKTVENFTNLSGQIQERQEEMQKEYTTILGIFASIVLAFTGGMVFSTSVLENIGDISIYRLIMVSCIIGIVFINMIWILVSYLARINQIKREKRPINSFFIWLGANIILFVIIIGTLVGYFVF